MLEVMVSLLECPTRTQLGCSALWMRSEPFLNLQQAFVCQRSPQVFMYLLPSF